MSPGARARRCSSPGLAALAVASPAQADTWHGDRDRRRRHRLQHRHAQLPQPARRDRRVRGHEGDRGHRSTSRRATININNDLVIQSDITVIGASARTTIIDGNVKYRGFRVTSTRQRQDQPPHDPQRRRRPGRLDRRRRHPQLQRRRPAQLPCASRRAARTATAAAIANYQGTLTLVNGLVDNNTAGDGGGIANIGGARDARPRPARRRRRRRSSSNTAGIGGTGGIRLARRAGQHRPAQPLDAGRQRRRRPRRRRPVIDVRRGAGRSATLIAAQHRRRRDRQLRRDEADRQRRQRRGRQGLRLRRSAAARTRGWRPTLAQRGRRGRRAADRRRRARPSTAAPTNCTAGSSTQRGLHAPAGPGVRRRRLRARPGRPTVTITAGPTRDGHDARRRVPRSRSIEPDVTSSASSPARARPPAYVTCYKSNAQPYTGLADGPTRSRCARSTPRSRARRSTRARSRSPAPNTTITGGPTEPDQRQHADVHVHRRTRPARRSSASVDGAAFARLHVAAHDGAADARARTRSRSARSTRAGRRTRRPPRDVHGRHAPRPNTTITGGPTGTVASTSATFTFTSTETGSTFQCALDGARVRRLPGRATRACAGRAHVPGPRHRRGRELGRARPRLADLDRRHGRARHDDQQPARAGSTRSTSATFTFSSTEAGATFQCALDGAAFGACPAGYTGLSQGSAHVPGPRHRRRRQHRRDARLAAPGRSTPSRRTPRSHRPERRGQQHQRDLHVHAPTRPARRSSARSTAPRSRPARRATPASPGLAHVPGARHRRRRQRRRIARLADLDGRHGRARHDHHQRAHRHRRAAPSATFTFTLDRGGRARSSARSTAPRSRACPASYTGLSQGSHTFQVRAIDAAGNIDQSPASQHLDRRHRRRRTRRSTPARAARRTSIRRRSRSRPTRRGATFQCRFDNAGPFAACTTPHTTGRSRRARTRSRCARSTPPATSIGTPASRTFVVDTNAPAAPVVEAPANNALLMANTVAFNGTAEPGTTVRTARGHDAEGQRGRVRNGDCGRS